MKRSSFLKSLGVLGAALFVNPALLFKKDEVVPKTFRTLKNGGYYPCHIRKYSLLMENGEIVHVIERGDGEITIPSWVQYVKVCRTKNPNA